MKKKKVANKKLWLFLTIALAVSVVSYGAVALFTHCEEPVPIGIALVVLISCAAGFLLADRIQSDTWKRLLKSVAIASLIALFAELALFQFSSYIVQKKTVSMAELTGITASNPESAVITPECITVQGNTELIIPVNQENIGALYFDTEYSSEKAAICALQIKDGNFSRKYIKVGEKSICDTRSRFQFSFYTYQTLESVKLNFSNVSAPITIRQMQLSDTLPFRFSAARFYGVFLIAAAILSVCALGWYKLVYDRKNIAHRAVILLLAGFCAMSMLHFLEPGEITYEKGMDVSRKDPFVQMFDALQKGQVHIDITPSEELLAMEDPYDQSVRSEEKVSFAWDRAFYNGKYYSYYGIAPVLVYYAPYYLFTGALPTLNKACVFFGILSVLFLFGAVLAFVRKFVKKPNFLALILCLFGGVFASGMLFNVNSSDMYALPGIAGTCFLMLCLWCGVEACMRKGEKKQPFLFVLSGIAFVLCLASKPTRALSCLIIAPVFLELLFTKTHTLRYKLYSAGAFLLPVLAGCGCLFAYNYARFDSPFDFGAAYQLTVSDVSANSLRIGLLPNALLHYFIQPVKVTGSFPFISIEGLYLTNRQTYIYSDFAAGALTFPLIAAACGVFPFELHRQLKPAPGQRICYVINAKTGTYLSMLLISLFIAWLNYCVAGIILSYVCDILPILSLLAAVLLTDALSHTQQQFGNPGKWVSILAAVTVSTAVLVILELLVLKKDVSALCVLEDILCFWR